MFYTESADEFFSTAFSSNGFFKGR